MNAVVESREALPVVSESAALLQVIERAASNPDIDIEKMERLLQMQERIMSKRAEEHFNEAMSAAQTEMGRISTDATNPQTRSRYATYGQLDRHLRPIYTKHGFSLSFGTAASPLTEHVRVVCTVANRGHSRQYEIDMPADGKGAKGGDVMTKTHATGAAASYGMRYLLKMIFNVAIGEDDKDGNETQACLTEEQVATLRSMLTEIGPDQEGKFLKWAKVKALGDILSTNYKACFDTIDEKRRSGRA